MNNQSKKQFHSAKFGPVRQLVDSLREKSSLSRLILPGSLILVISVVALFFLQSQYRSNLIPLNADHDQRMVLLTGDEPSYLLMSQAIADGHGLNVRPVITSGAYQRFYHRPVISDDLNTWKYYFASGWIVPVINNSASWRDAQKMPFTPLLPLLMAPYINWVDNTRWLTGLIQSVLTCALFFVLMRRLAFFNAKRIWIPRVFCFDFIKHCG
jgi:hypothetical protein